MSLFFIVGSPSAGKTSVCLALREMGYEAYDTDGDGFARWQNLHTGYVHPKSSVKSADRTPEFLEHHKWQVPRSEVEKLSAKADGKIIFLCGDIGNQSEVRDIFDGVFALHIDEETLKHRLATRLHNDWGKQPHELLITLEKHRMAFDQYKVMEAVVIDGVQSVQQVASKILSKVKTIS